MIKIIFKHKDEHKAVQAGSIMASALNQLPPIGVQGPVPALISKVRNQFIQEVWIRCPRDSRAIEETKQLIKEQRQTLISARGNNALQVIVDVDPV